MTATRPPHVRRRPPTPGPRRARGSGCSGSASRPTGPSSRACASASRATSAASRSASRELGAEVVSAGLVDTAQGAREAGDRFARRAGRPRALPRRHLRDLEPGAAGRAGGQGAGRAARAAADGRRSTTRTPTPASGWPTAPRAACRSSRAPSRARGSPTTPSPGTIDDDERAWAKIARLGARRRRRRALRRVADRLPRAHLSGHARPVLGLHRRPRPARRARRGARDRRPRRARGAGHRGRASRPRRPRSARCSTSPTRRTTRSPGRSSDEQLDWSARVAAGLDRLAADFELDGLTYYYRGARRQRGRAPRRRRDRRQLAADRARRSRPRARATSRPTSPS